MANAGIKHAVGYLHDRLMPSIAMSWFSFVHDSACSCMCVFYFFWLYFALWVTNPSFFVLDRKTSNGVNYSIKCMVDYEKPKRQAWKMSLLE